MPQNKALYVAANTLLTAAIAGEVIGWLTLVPAVAGWTVLTTLPLVAIGTDPLATTGCITYYTGAVLTA